MSLKLKICGMRDPANIAEVAALQPDYMGFIFYQHSPRYVGDDFKMPMIPSTIKRVGVFVNSETERIIKSVRDYQLDFVQLHGNETIGQCEKLRAAGIEIVKVFSVDRDFDFGTVNPFKDYVQYFLFDTRGEYFGGNARTFDWSLLRKYDQSVPFILSGGISARNAGRIKEFGDLNIYALDVNSGTELSPGLKDVTKVQELKQIMNTL